MVETKDTGLGISKENIDKILDLFFSTKEMGTGLGLSVSSSIIKSYGGDMKFKSKEGEGTTVTVVLPLD